MLYTFIGVSFIQEFRVLRYWQGNIFLCKHTCALNYRHKIPISILKFVEKSIHYTQITLSPKKFVSQLSFKNKLESFHCALCVQ